MSEIKNTSPFAALTYQEQQDRWREWRSRQLDYIAAEELPPVELPVIKEKKPPVELPVIKEKKPPVELPGQEEKKPPVEAVQERKKESSESAQPVQYAAPRFPVAPAPTRHKQLDSLMYKHKTALKNASTWQPASTRESVRS